MKERLSKLVNVYRKYGFRGFWQKLLLFLKARCLDAVNPEPLLHPVRVRRLLQSMLNEDCSCIILWRSSFGYRTPLFQRPQHMARNLARCGCLVIYEVSRMTDNCPLLCRLDRQLWLFNFNNLFLRHMLMQRIRALNKPMYLQFYSTDWKLSVRTLQDYQAKGFGLIYEYVDHISPELAGTSSLPKNISEKYSFVMSDNEVYVVTTAERLKKDVIAHRGTTRLLASGNGVDYAFFQHWESYRFEPEMRAVLDCGLPIVCYYGALACWVDYELIKEIAATGKYSVLLIGIKYDGSFDENMHGEENIFFLGQRDYTVLKYYAREASVLLLPFLVNDITRATNPVKLFEYMALHRPIVCTDLDECRRYQSVLIARDHKDFLKKIQEAIQLSRDPDYLTLLDKEAQENDWFEKAAALVQMLQKDR